VTGQGTLDEWVISDTRGIPLKNSWNEPFGSRKKPFLELKMAQQRKRLIVLKRCVICWMCDYGFLCGKNGMRISMLSHGARDCSSV